MCWQHCLFSFIMATREILTLQFGHYSNFIGTHFWNIQERSFDYTGTKNNDINHDVLYREGQTERGEVTYTPRLLLADLKGSLKTLPPSGGLPIETDREVPPWEAIETIEEPAPEKNQFLKDIETDDVDIEEKEYNFEEDVNTWTDFLYPRFHSRSVNIIKEYSYEEHERFDIHHSGLALWKQDFGEIFSDNIRKYVEECDSIQGFHINFDCTDGFSGLAIGCVQHLADEYTKPILAHPIIASYFPDNDPKSQEDRDKSTLKDSIRLVNLSLSIQELSEHATMFVPLCTGEKGWRKPGNPRTFEHIDYNPQLYYHSSALLAAALDTLSQKYRHKTNLYTLSDVAADMTGYGRKMAAASLGIPFAFNESKYLIEHLNETTKPIYSSITPSCKIATDKLFQLITVRGMPESYIKAPLKEAKEQMNLPAYRCNSVKEMLELYFQASNFLSATNVTVAKMPLELKTPFPRIFSNNLNKYGYIKDRDSQETAKSCPVIAGYHNGNFMADMIEKLHREVSRIKFAKLHMFGEEGLEAEEYQESLNKIAEFKDNYEDDFEL